jgi:hypothetical protein
MVHHHQTILALGKAIRGAQFYWWRKPIIIIIIDIQ